MTNKRKFFTSESVTEGHPDKICDQISDAVLDAILTQDPKARVACETAVTTGLVLVMGEITTSGYADIQRIVRETVDEIGYNRGKYGFDAENLAVLVAINEQSPDIAMGVKDGEGAGDQGMMFGYACRETEELMPLPIILAHRLTRALSVARKSKQVNYLRPDGKSQVTVEYDEQGKPSRIEAVVVSTQHDEHVSIEELEHFVKEEIIKKSIPAELLDEKTHYFVNPTGRFVVGGPKGDSGLTGRKIIVDTYGGFARHGGGAFSGKDSTKVDRSASYAARYIAKNIVASGLAEKCEIQLSYAIGVSEPTSVMVETFQTGKLPDNELMKIVRNHFDLTPLGIIRMLDLRRPIFKQTASYGHFGRTDVDLPWERTDRVDVLKTYLR